VAGASAAAAVVGIPFGLSNRANRDEIASIAHTQDEKDRLNSRQMTQGMVADALFAAALGGACVALWLALHQD
jgi:hypothetical protein